MRKLLIICSVLALYFSGTYVKADTADDFLKAYFHVQDGDAAEKGGDAKKAIAKYSDALNMLRRIKAGAPDWNPNIISYRIKYCAEHIVKNGGTVPDESSAAAQEKPQTAPTSTINTVPSGAVPSNPPPEPEPAPQPPAPAPPTPAPEAAPEATDAPPVSIPTITATPEVNSSNDTGGSSAEQRVTKLERELDLARAELQRVREEKNDLESRLKRAEESLRNSNLSGDDRVQALLKENHSLKDQLAQTEKKLRDIPSSSDNIAALRNELAQTQSQLESVQRENEQLKAANEYMKKELEDTRTQLRTTTSGQDTGISSDTLQTLQKENSLLRSIVERQYQEDARRMAARDSLTIELKELSSRAESIRSQLEVLQTPLTPLSSEEKSLLKMSISPVAIQTESDPNKLSGVVTAKRSSSATPASSTLTDSGAALAREARQLFAKGDLNGAGAKFEEILKTDPNNLFALSNLGVVRFRQDRINEAEKALQGALAIDPHDAFSLSVLGIVNYRQGRFDDSISALTRAIALDPNNHETHNYLGITYSQKGYQEAAEKELLKAIEIQPNYADAHFNLAVVYASENPPSVEMAKKHYQKAIELGMAKDPELEKLLVK